LIGFLLVLITFVVYWPVTHFGFINHDDPEYVINNPMVHAGLTGASIVWAFETFYASNWHPLTWMSHMLDCRIWGNQAGGHHMTNVLLHGLNVVLLFLLLRRLTNATWRSAWAAALFAWHPLHVESVAWISERKDVLSMFFGLLSIWAYVRSREPSREQEARSKKQGARRHEPGSRITHHASRFRITQASRFYLLSLLLFALGLMSKPMLVTLPFVFLLLDYWPLGRVAGDEWRVTGEAGTGARRVGSALRLCVVEKLPFLVLSGVDCVATMWAQQNDAIINLDVLPFSERLANAAMSYLLYLAKLFWPARLAVLYPYPEWPLWQPISAAAILLMISAVVLWQRQCRPYLAVGWFWFVGTLVPVIGLVQVGRQGMADRYTYLPSVGIFIAFVWGVAELVRHSKLRVQGSGFSAGTLSAVSAIILIVLILCTSRQLGYWQNSVAVFSRALEVNPNNVLAEYNVGQALQSQGDQAGAMSHYLHALEIQPSRVEAVRDFRPSARVNLGGILAEEGKWTEAEAQFREVVRQRPGAWHVRSDLADALAALGRLDEAVAQYRIALRVAPESAEVWRRLGVALYRQLKSAEALAAYRQAVKCNPNGPLELNELAWFLATDPNRELRDGVEAIRLAQHACELTGRAEPRCLGTLDAAYAEAGLWKDAIETAQVVKEMALAQNRPDLAAAAAERLELYRAEKPYHQPKPGQASTLSP
jgi:tetratricopeptide (TPR) repeat protein